MLFSQTASLVNPFSVAVGFRSPAEDYAKPKMDLNQFLVAHPAATFFVKVEGSSMEGAGIFSGDMLVVDKSLEPKNNATVVAILDGEFVIKKIRKAKGRIYCINESPGFDPVAISYENELEIWGVVTHVIHKY